MWRYKSCVIHIIVHPTSSFLKLWTSTGAKLCLHLFIIHFFKFCFVNDQLFVYFCLQSVVCSNFVSFIISCLFTFHCQILFITFSLEIICFCYSFTFFCLRLTICLHSVKNQLFVYICLQSAACLELAVWLHFVGKYLNLQRNCTNFALQRIFQKW